MTPFQKTLCFLFFLLGLSSLSNAQKMKTYQMTYQGNRDDHACGLLQLPDKGFLLFGLTESISSFDILIIRTDSLCNHIWTKKYGGSSDEGIYTFPYKSVSEVYKYAVDAIIAPDGNVVVCSSTSSYGRYGFDVYLFKIDLNGNVKWSRTYGDVNDDYGMSVVNDAHGGFLITGEYGRTSTNKSNSDGNGDLLLIKTDSIGKMVWAKTYGSTTNEELGTKIIPSHDGNFLIGGTTYIPSLTTPAYNHLLMKVDSSGKLLWDKVYGYGGFSILYTLVEVPGDGIYTGGSVSLPGVIGPQATMLFSRFDLSGNYDFSKTYYEGRFQKLNYDVKQNLFNASADILYSPRYLDQGSVVRLNTNGNINFIKTYGIRSQINAYELGVGDDFIPLTGGNGFAFLESTPINGKKFELMKMDASANPNLCDIYTNVRNPTDLTLADRTYKFSTTTITPVLGSGMASSALTSPQVMLCRPINVNFKWSGKCTGTPVYFTDTTYLSPKIWKWNFDDPGSPGNTSFLQNPQHVYSKPGKYVVKLIASNANDTDSVAQTITILQSPILAPITLKQVHDTITFIPKDTLKGQFTWHFNDPSFTTSTKKEPIFIYPNKTNNYIVNVTLKDSNGCFDTQSDTVKIIRWGVYAAFKWKNQCAGKPTSFIDSSYNNPKKWIWNFGDSLSKSDTSSARNPKHTYTKPGTYVVHLHVYGSDSDSMVHSVTIYADPILAPWGKTINRNMVTFTPQDTTFAYYEWYFGTKNHDSSSQKIPVFRYPNDSASYLVSLVITNQGGCTASRSDSVFIVKSGIKPALNTIDNLNIFPNPFEGRTTIQYTLKIRSQLNISIYDIAGKQVAILKNGPFEAGTYSDLFDAEKYKCPLNMYILKIVVNGDVIERRIEVVKK